jgi:hypothetical protein
MQGLQTFMQYIFDILSDIMLIIITKIGAGLAAMLLRILAEAQVLGAVSITGESWLFAGILGVSVVIGVFLSTFIAFYITFKIAKRQKRKT